MTLKKHLAGYLIRGMIAYGLLIAIGNALSYAQPPAWLSPSQSPAAQPRTGEALAPPAAAAKIKTKTIVRVDTVKIVETKTDTVQAKPESKLKYKLQICNLDYERIISTKINLYSYKFSEILSSLNNEEKTKNCYFSSAVSDSSYSYSYGVESLRTNGYIYDNYGNKLEQTEKVLVGVTLSVKGESIKFDYLENKKLSLQNTFHDNEANFYADYSIFERKCNFWVFCNFTEKKQYLFLNLTREEM